MLDFGGGSGYLARAFGGQVFEYGGELENNRYNTIAMSHVLEHLPYPVETLKELRSLLSDDGVLFIEVPWAYDMNAPIFVTEPHVTNYGVYSLSLMLRKCGYVIWDLTTCYWPTIGTVIRCVAKLK
jgi:hypothetical protein